MTNIGFSTLRHSLKAGGDGGDEEVKEENFIIKKGAGNDPRPPTICPSEGRFA
jgi:hypothetical protein